MVSEDETDNHARPKTQDPLRKFQVTRLNDALEAMLLKDANRKHVLLNCIPSLLWLNEAVVLVEMYC
jgi:hypothetical protein